MAKLKKIKPLEAYGGVSDVTVVSRGTAVATGCTNNPNYPNMPVSAADLKTNLDGLSALIAEAADGSKKVIAQKNKQREAVIKMLRLIGRYVEVTSNGDMAIFKSSGFEPASTVKAAPQPLPQPTVGSVDHGPVTGQLLVRFKAVPKASSYEIRYAAMANGAPGNWTMEVVTSLRKPVTIGSLSPGTVYAVQIRALGMLGWTNWSDSVTCMCV